MGQIAIFTYIYLQTIGQNKRASLGDRIKIVIPSGACGNVCSALFAREMGLPIDIIVANNSNAFFHRIYHTGEIVVSGGNQHQTVSNAMDSQWSPALTRILWCISPQQSEGLYDGGALKKLKSGHSIHLSHEVKESLHSKILGCEMACNDETVDMMVHLYNSSNNSNIVCPHTAVGFVAVAKHYQELMGSTNSELKFHLDKDDILMSDNTSQEDLTVVFATAHPDKFSNVISEKAKIPYKVTHTFPTSKERYQKLSANENWNDRILKMLENSN